MIHRAYLPKRFATVAESLAAIASCEDTGALCRVWLQLPKRGRELSGSVKRAYDARKVTLLAREANAPAFDAF